MFTLDPDPYPLTTIVDTDTDPPEVKRILIPELWNWGCGYWKKIRKYQQHTRRAPESAMAVGRHRSTDVQRTSTPIEESAIAKRGLSRSLKCSECFKIQGRMKEARYPWLWRAIHLIKEFPGYVGLRIAILGRPIVQEKSIREYSIYKMIKFAEGTGRWKAREPH